MASFKDLLVVVDHSKGCATRLEVAVHLAQACGAHLTGLYVITPPQVPRFVESQLSAEVLDHQMRVQREAAQKMQELFRAKVDVPGLVTEWREREGDAADVVGLHARYADFAIVGQLDPEDEEAAYAGDLAARLVLEVGRPLLVVPYVGTYPTVGERVLVAWNASREATRAVNDALPILEKARKVRVLAINPHGGPLGHGEVPGADIALHLARHGVTAEISWLKTEDVDVDAMLLSQVADADADLLVMGAYGRSRLRELVMGGVTRQILQAMTIPVFMSH